jgi:hypothetical protein
MSEPDYFHFKRTAGIVGETSPLHYYTNNRVLGVNAVYDISERQRAVIR